MGIIKLVRQLGHWLRGRRSDEELREEIETHRVMIQRDLESRGMTPAQAAVTSRRAMGNATLAREDARDVWVVAAVDRVWRDVRYGLRTFSREPMFALTVIAILAVGVATTTTAFSVADAELWKPLPYPQPERLVAVDSSGPGARASAEYISGGDFLDWSAQSHGFAGLSATGETRRRVLQRATAEAVTASSVTSNYFATLGTKALLGRTFSASDAREGGAILTDRGWQRLFDADPAVIGRTLTLDTRPVRIVGVVRSDQVMALASDPDLFLALDVSTREFRDRAGRAVTSVIGRLRPGVDAAGAQAELQTIASRITRAYPDGRTGRSIHVEDLRTYHTGFNWRPLYFALGASLIVLLLTCANVASLLLARALRRRREFAIRGALGGGLGALVQQLAVEGALLALPAGAVALLLTYAALGALTTQLPPDYLVRGTAIPIDARVCAFALGAAAFCAPIFGLVPPLIARRTDLSLTLGDGGRTAGSAPTRSFARQLLLVAQIAMTLVLVAGAGLFLKSYASLRQVPVGFDARDRVALRVSLSGPRYVTDQQIQGYANVLLERARAVPGVRDATVATSSPLNSGPLVHFAGGTRAAPAPGDEPRAILRATAPGFFRVLGIPVLQGREFNEHDAAGAPPVAVVNEVLARRLFPSEEAVGRTLTLLPGARAPWTRRPGELTIVGVVSNVKEVGLNEVEFNDIYVPFAQTPAPGFELIVHAAIPPSSLSDDLRALAGGVDRNIPVGPVGPLERRVTDALREDRFHLMLIGAFAAVAITLAGIGIYGAVAYAAQERRREFGVRLALGARPAGLVLMALRESLRVGMIGGALGLAISLLVAKLLGTSLHLVPGEHNGLLYGVQTTDPVILGSALVGLLVLALAAGAVPARGVARLDPLDALRPE
jgi:putative ABC transport system permease protein